MSSKPTINEESKARRLSELPEELRKNPDIQKLDDGKGNIDEKAAVASVAQVKSTNKSLWKFLSGALFFALLSVGSVYFTSTAAVHLTKDTDVDQDTGIATVKGSDVTVKTNEATFVLDVVNPGNMKADELSDMKSIAAADGSFSFNVNGFSKSSSEVVLFVEGGSLKYDKELGIVDATGDAGLLYAHATAGQIEDGGRRNLKAKWEWVETRLSEGSAEMPSPGNAVGVFVRGGHNIAIAKNPKGEVFAVSNKLPFKSAFMKHGTVENGYIVDPLGNKYSLTTGKVVGSWCPDVQLACAGVEPSQLSVFDVKKGTGGKYSVYVDVNARASFKAEFLRGQGSVHNGLDY